jgi:ATP-binding cassette subfamily G (WHITE) protein 2 (SNQ2)
MAEAEIPALFMQRPIIARHEKAAMYHPFIEAAALTIVDTVCVTSIVLLLYSVALYFLIGFQSSAKQYL